MKAADKQAWIDALNSGEYKQARGRLCDNEGRMCCLGVAIDVLVDADWVHEYELGWGVYTGESYPSFDTGKMERAIEMDQLPDRISDKLGISLDQMYELMHQNDGFTEWMFGPDKLVKHKPKNFKQIAKWIEANL